MASDRELLTDYAEGATRLQYVARELSRTQPTEPAAVRAFVDLARQALQIMLSCSDVAAIASVRTVSDTEPAPPTDPMASAGARLLGDDPIEGGAQ
jgi:hypothetical protein